jgi:uncharacterized damage-inducible protein DinB
MQDLILPRNKRTEMTTQSKPNKSAFLQTYAKDRATLHAFINALTESQLSGPTDAAGWTIKDHLAHLAAWQLGIAVLLQGGKRWEAMGLTSAFVKKSEGFEPLNAALQRRHSKLSAREVLELLSNADAQFLFALSKLSSADLAKSYAHFSGEPPTKQTAQPVMGWVDGDSAHHFREHLPWMRKILSGERARLIQLYGDGPDLLDAALKKAPRAMWRWKPSKKDWSVHEILVHLADSETNSYLRCRKALAEPGKPIMAYDQDTWAVALDYHARDAEASRALTRIVRAQTHSLIVTLSDSDWRKSYFHPESNKLVPLSEWLRGYADHIPGHVTQIQNNLALWLKRGKPKA